MHSVMQAYTELIHFFIMISDISRSLMMVKSVLLKSVKFTFFLHIDARADYVSVSIIAFGHIRVEIFQYVFRRNGDRMGRG